VRVHVALGNLYVFEHNPGQAQLEFMKVIELDPKNPAAHVALANLYMDEAQFPLAENQYRGAIALDEARANYRVDLGKVLIKENKLVAAEDEFRTAIGLDPKNAQAHFELAKLLESQPNRKAEADSEFEQAHALDPKLAPPSAPTAVASAPESVAKPSIKPLNKIFLLTHDSAVYQSPDQASAAIAKVRRKKYVHVVGITGDWLEIKLRNGTTGFIPTSAAQ
ncbi:MAG TPA: tetratricopeptide repeat protein, partial [Candidatus Binataceae bacterium]|nr:tetratricopeptide repeat protein [Candidatus Binataceae bacterium]